MVQQTSRKHYNQFSSSCSSTKNDSDTESEYDIFDNTELNQFIDTENWKFKHKNLQVNFYNLYKARSAQWVGDRKHLKNQDVTKDVKQLYTGYYGRKSHFNYISDLFDFAKDNYNYTLELGPQQQKQKTQQIKLNQLIAKNLNKINTQSSKLETKKFTFSPSPRIPKLDIPYALQYTIKKQKIDHNNSARQQQQKPIYQQYKKNLLNINLNAKQIQQSQSNNTTSNHNERVAQKLKHNFTQLKTEQYESYFIDNNNKRLQTFIDRDTSLSPYAKEIQSQRNLYQNPVYAPQINKRQSSKEIQHTSQNLQQKQQQPYISIQNNNNSLDLQPKKLNSQKSLKYSNCFQKSSTTNLFNDKYFCSGYNSNSLQNKKNSNPTMKSFENILQQSTLSSQCQTPLQKQNYMLTERNSTSKNFNNNNNSKTTKNKNNQNSNTSFQNLVKIQSQNYKKNISKQKISENLNLSKDTQSPFLNYLENLSKTNNSIETSILTSKDIVNIYNNRTSNASNLNSCNDLFLDLSKSESKNQIQKKQVKSQILNSNLNTNRSAVQKKKTKMVKNTKNVSNTKNNNNKKITLISKSLHKQCTL